MCRPRHGAGEGKHQLYRLGLGIVLDMAEVEELCMRGKIPNAENRGSPPCPCGHVRDDTRPGRREASRVQCWYDADGMADRSVVPSTRGKTIWN